ncbi:hypothetical protein I4U23_028972 [Adineta vaga]|nr:hypothetical protein I4U23_028972 [Adineta vaga]
MLRLAFVLLMMIAAYHSSFGMMVLGGYSERPELIEDDTVVLLTHYAAGYLHTSENIRLKDLKIVRVQTQVVSGTNYKIDFIGEPIDGAGEKTKCQVVIYLSWNLSKSISNAECETL